MKLALVAFSDKQEFRLQIREEMIDRGHQCDLKPFSVLPINASMMDDVFMVLRQYDVVHFVLGFNEELAKTLQARLSSEGVICPNNRSNATNINDKIFQMVELAKVGVPTPRSVRLVSPDKSEVRASLGFPCVIKEPVGSKGEKVALCTENNFDEVIKPNKEYLGQELVRYTADYRVHVAGNETFCIYERVAPEGDFRANVSLGGAMKKVDDAELLIRLSELALQTTRALSMDYGGVDIIKDESGNLFVLEFNPNPGFKNVTDVTGAPFYRHVADYYESLMQ